MGTIESCFGERAPDADAERSMIEYDDQAIEESFLSLADIQVNSQAERGRRRRGKSSAASVLSEKRREHRRGGSTGSRRRRKKRRKRAKERTSTSGLQGRDESAESSSERRERRRGRAARDGNAAESAAQVEAGDQSSSVAANGEAERSIRAATEDSGASPESGSDASDSESSGSGGEAPQRRGLGERIPSAVQERDDDDDDDDDDDEEEEDVDDEEEGPSGDGRVPGTGELAGQEAADSPVKAADFQEALAIEADATPQWTQLTGKAEERVQVWTRSAPGDSEATLRTKSYFFLPDFSPAEVFDALFVCKRRVKWDSDYQVLRSVEEMRDGTEVLYSKFGSKVPGTNDQDFVDYRKAIRQPDGSFVIVFKEATHPQCGPQSDTTRCRTLFSANILRPAEQCPAHVRQYMPANTKTVYFQLGQSEVTTSIPWFVMRMLKGQIRKYVVSGAIDWRGVLLQELQNPSV